MFKHTIVLSVAIGLCTASSFAQPTIDRLAPENSIVVAGIDDFKSSLTAFKKTPLWDLWQSDEIAEMFNECYGNYPSQAAG